MKHLKPLNNKARILEQAAAEDRVEEAMVMSAVAAAPPPPTRAGKWTPLVA